MFCPHCGNKIDDESIFCRFCGKDVSTSKKNTENESTDLHGGIISNEEINIQQNATSPTNDNCPICKRDDRVHRLKVVFADGIKSESSSGPVIGVGLSGGKIGVGIGGTSQSGTSISAQSERLSPPDKPKKSGGCLVVFGALALGFIVDIIIFQYNGKHNFLIIFGIAIAIMVIAFTNINKKYNLKMEIYQTLLDEWESSYYCSRDDVIFIPNRDYCMSPEQLRDYYNEKINIPQEEKT